jgi:hypothetical protein
MTPELLVFLKLQLMLEYGPTKAGNRIGLKFFVKTC